jgi:hypothetical protein
VDSPPPAVASPAAEPPTAAEGAPAGEADSAWPDESAEAQFLAEARERGETVAAASAPATEPEAAEPDPGGPAPELDALVARLPPAVRETLDELFRARFVRVTRLPKKSLTAAKG